MSQLYSAVIVRLVRNCALGRTIQYAVASRLYRWRRRLLDAPPARGMTIDGDGPPYSAACGPVAPPDGLYLVRVEY